jgi:hypothetical protein
MGAPSPPSSSDINSSATALGNEQTSANTAAQAGSQYNQSNPYGSLTYTQTGVGPNGVPTYTASESLSPQQQQLYNQYTGTQDTAGSQAGSLLNSAGYGNQSAASAIGTESSGLEGQYMNQWLQGVQPFMTTQTNQLQTQLANQGLTSSDPAYQTAMRQLTTNQNLAVDQQATAAQNQAYTQAMGTYNEPATLATTLASFAAPTTPNASFTSNTPAANAADYTGATTAETSADLGAYNAQYQQYANLMSGLFGLGGAGIKGLTAAV